MSESRRYRGRSASMIFLLRHRAAVYDIALIAAIFVIGIYLAFEYDFYPNAPGSGVYEKTIELDEALTLAGVLIAGMLVFSVRRYLEQRREMARRVVATTRLRESGRRFSSLLQTVELASLMLDESGRVTYVNDFLLRITGWEIGEIIGRNWFERFVADPARGLDSASGSTATALRIGAHDQTIRTRDGGTLTIRWNPTILRSAEGNPIGIASIGEDITHRKLQDAKITRLLRTQRMLSSVNELIVRSRDRRRLFEQACRIAVEDGGFRMAWIGMLEQDDLLRIVAGAGFDDGYSELIRDSILANRVTPASVAIKSGEACVCNDIANDALMSRWRDIALVRDYRSMVACPIRINQRSIGCLTLYASEVGAFNTEELALILQLVDDIAYAMEFIARDERLDYLSSYDPLTGLSNRSLYRERLDGLMSAARASSGIVAVAMIDITSFKTINDLVFRSGGNQVLKLTAERLKTFAGSAHLVGRAEGDRFLLTLPDVESAAQLGSLLRSRFWPLWEAPMEVGGLELRVTVRIGIALMEANGDAPVVVDDLLRDAEAALKAAKSRGNVQQFYVRGMGAASAERLTLEWRVRQAAESREFALFYQPKFSARTGRICGAEALLRWNSPVLGWVSPARFVPLLEETGLILDIGSWALRQAASDRQKWLAAGLQAPRIAVNVSPVQLQQNDFVDLVMQAVGTGSEDSSGIDIEVTESMLMNDVEQTIAKLAALRAIGMSVSIDDFGTGYSSLAYLARLPISSLKIDRSFVIRMVESRETLAVVSTIISLAKSLALSIVAEGVETSEQLAALQQLGCDEIQGYIYSPAVTAEAFSGLLTKEYVRFRSVEVAESV